MFFPDPVVAVEACAILGLHHCAADPADIIRVDDSITRSIKVALELLSNLAARHVASFFIEPFLITVRVEIPHQLNGVKIILARLCICVDCVEPVTNTVWCRERDASTTGRYCRIQTHPQFFKPLNVSSLVQHQKRQRLRTTGIARSRRRFNLRAVGKLKRCAVVNVNRRNLNELRQPAHHCLHFLDQVSGSTELGSHNKHILVTVKQHHPNDVSRHNG